MAQSNITFNTEKIVSQSPILQQLVEGEDFKSSCQLPIVLGTTDRGAPVVTDLAKMPHLLIGGLADHKEYIQTLITPLLLKWQLEDLKLIVIDESTAATDAIQTIESLREEMDRRYRLLLDAEAENLEDYNYNAEHKCKSKLPYIILIVNEFGNLMTKLGRQFEFPIAMLAMKSRAVGIHIIMSTCACTYDVFSGIIKANFPDRIALNADEKFFKMITDMSDISCIGEREVAYVINDKCLLLNRINLADTTTK